MQAQSGANVIQTTGRFVRFSQKLRLDSARRRELGHLSLRQFFVTIEQLPELDQLEVRSRPTPRQDDTTRPQPRLTSAPQAFNIPATVFPFVNFATNLSFRFGNTSSDIGRRRFGDDTVSGRDLF